MQVRILRMFADDRHPHVPDKLVDGAIAHAQAVDIQNIPAEIPADQAQSHLDTAVPVHADHVGIRLPPGSNIVAEQHKEPQVLARLVGHGEMQQELHPAHFPHMLHAAELVVEDIYVEREAQREPLARRDIQMPIYFLVDVNAGFENRVILVRILVVDNGTVRNGKRHAEVVLCKPIEKTVANELADTVQELPYRKNFMFLEIPGCSHCQIIISFLTEMEQPTS